MKRSGYNINLIAVTEVDEFSQLETGSLMIDRDAYSSDAICISSVYISPSL